MKLLRLAKTVAVIIVIFLTLSLIGAEAAEPLPPPMFPTTTPEKKQIVVENIYNFQIVRYQPPVTVHPLKNRKNATYQRPEATIISHVSAMMLNDWEWFQEGWTRKSWKEIEERNKSLGRTSSSILDRWKKFFRGKKVQLTERIDSGEYVIVYYKVTGKKGTLFAVMRLEDGKWLITNELITDPVVISGKEGKTLIKKVIR